MRKAEVWHYDPNYSKYEINTKFLFGQILTKIVIVAGIFHKRNTLVKTTIQMIFDKSDYSGKGGGKVVSC